MTTKRIHISEVKPGDVILHFGRIKTLDATFIKKSGFMGDTIWGDSYALGNKPVLLILNVNEPKK